MNRLPMIFFLLAFLIPAAFLGHAASARPQAPAASRILALASSVQDDLATVGTVDVLSGTISAYGSGLAACCNNSVLDAALDAAGRRYFAVLARNGESSQRLLTFNTETGAVTASTPLTTSISVNYMAYDTASSQLLALVFSTDPYALQMARINPTTAALTLLNNPIPDCCGPIAFDAAYDDINRKLYAVLQPYTNEEQTRLVTFSGSNGSVLADVPITVPFTVPITDTFEIHHLAFEASGTEAGGTLWALVNVADDERLAVIDTITGIVTPLGSGAANCCNRMVTDVAIDPIAQVLIAPMVDTPAGGYPVPTFFRFSLSTGEVLGSAPIDEAYSLYYIAYDPMPPAPPTPTATATSEPTATPAADLYMPLLERH